MWFLVYNQTFIPTNQTFLLEKVRGFAIISTSWFTPCHNETIIDSSHISDLHCCFITRCVKSVPWPAKPGAALPVPFFPFPSSPFTFSSVPPYSFSALCHRQSYNNLMFEWGRNIEFLYSCLVYLTSQIILLSVVSISWININITATKKITVFS